MPSVQTRWEGQWREGEGHSVPCHLYHCLPCLPVEVPARQTSGRVNQHFPTLTPRQACLTITSSFLFCILSGVEGGRAVEEI